MNEVSFNHRQAAIFFILLLCNCSAKWIPPSLPWFIHTNAVEDLGPYLKTSVPIGYRNVILFAQNISILSDVILGSKYSDYFVPFELTIICERLHVRQSHTLTLSAIGAKAPDLLSSNDRTNTDALQGKAGGNGGSLYIFAKYKTGNGRLVIDVSGGDGGKGQKGYTGTDGARGQNDIYLAGIVWRLATVGDDGTNGGDGGTGGKGGDAGEVNINTMSSISTFVHRMIRNRGSGGAGGKGGTGGMGGLGGISYMPRFDVHTQSYVYVLQMPSGSDGENGAPGRRGDHGNVPDLVFNQYNSTNAFYQSLPITGLDLHKVLDSELVRLRYAKHQRDANKIQIIRNTITHIKKIAAGMAYDVIERRCSDMLRLSNQNEELRIANEVTRIQKLRVKERFHEICKVACDSVDTNSDFQRKAVNSQRLKKYSVVSRAFNYVYNFANKLKERFETAKSIINEFELTACSFGSDLLEVLVTQNFYPHLHNTLQSKAKENPIIVESLERDSSTSAADKSVVVQPPDFWKFVLSQFENGRLEEVVEAFRVAVPEEAVLQAITWDVLRKVLVHYSSLFERISRELFLCEEALSKDAKKSGNKAKAKVDKSVKNQPKKRVPYISKGPRTEPIPDEDEEDPDNPPKPSPDPPDDPPRPPRPKSLSGKYIGVLEICESVNSVDNGNEVIATFDAIYIAFTTDDPEESIDMNNGLNLIQQEQFEVELEYYRSPLSNSFLITVPGIRNENSLHENNVGRWFEFDVQYTFFGRATVLMTSNIVSEIEIHLSRVISLSADVSIPASVTSIKPLLQGSQLERIVYQLGLSLDYPSQDRSNNYNVIDSTSSTQQIRQYYINHVKVVNVGQGSCNLLFEGNVTKAVYDLGYGYGLTMSAADEQTLVHNIISSPLIIISHWDRDHYSYLLKYPSIYASGNKMFVAPHFGSNQGVTVRNLVNLINSYQQLNLFGTQSEQRIHTILGFTNSNLDIRTTSLTSGRNKNNVGAITLSVLDNQRRPLFLMPGDASFDYISPSQRRNGLSDSLCYLIATHHASTRNIGRRSIPAPADSGSAQSRVYFSYGIGNPYGHSWVRAWPLYLDRGWGDHIETANSQPTVNIDLSNILSRSSPTCT